MSARRHAWDNLALAIRAVARIEHTGPLHADLCVLFADAEALRERVADWTVNPAADGEARLKLLSTARVNENLP